MKKTRLEIGPEENPACGHTDRREDARALLQSFERTDTRVYR